MAFVSPRMSLKIWNAASDPYDHEQLADNWRKLDLHDHSQGRGTQIAGDGISEGYITTVHIYPGSIGPDALADGAIGTGKLEDGSVTTEKLADESVTLAKLALAVQQALVPVGSIVATGCATAAAGYLLCDGSLVSRVTYEPLFDAIGTAYGVGDGSTTFGLPDLRGRVPVGKDAAQAEFNVLGELDGAKTHSHTGSAPSHTHTTSMPSHTHDAGSYHTVNHGHAIGSLYAAASASRGNDNYDTAAGVAEAFAYQNHQHSLAGSLDGSGDLYVTGSSSGPSATSAVTS